MLNLDKRKYFKLIIKILYKWEINFLVRKKKMSKKKIL